jgi:hypothetical protein
LILYGTPIAINSGYIPGGDHSYDTRQSPCLAIVDMKNVGMRMGTAKNRSVDHALHREIGGIERGSEHLVSRIDPPMQLWLCRNLGFRQRYVPAKIRCTGNRIQDAHVAGAPAQIAPQCLGNLRSRRRWIAVQKGLGCHDRPGGAETALYGIGRNEGFLQWVKPL